MQRLLPRSGACPATRMSGSEVVMGFPEAAFLRGRGLSLALDGEKAGSAVKGTARSAWYGTYGMMRSW